jgi:hypothetical protein
MMIADCKLAISEGVTARRAKSRSMTDHRASRTLVKSSPELWAECSDAASLARHLGRFGEIRITRLEPETDVAWEGEHVSGTVRLEPSGWGTRVTLTARGPEPTVSAIEDPPVARACADDQPPAETGDGPSPSPVGEGSSADSPPPGGEGSSGDPRPAAEEGSSADSPRPATARPGFLTRLFGRLRRAPSSAPAPAPPGFEPDVEAVEHDEPPKNVAPAGSGSPDDRVSPGDHVSPDDQVSPGDQGGSSHLEGPADRGAVDPPAVLASALESLGQAHHRPYSRH